MPIYAVLDGRVVGAADGNFDRRIRWVNGAKANYVIVDHGGCLFTLYAHLSEIEVEEGRRVAKGEIVGRVGATGRVTGPHLHWGAKIGSRPVDPMALMDQALFP